MNNPFFVFIFLICLFIAHFYELTWDNKTNRSRLVIDRWSIVVLGIIYLFTIAGGFYEYVLSGCEVNIFLTIGGLVLLVFRFLLKYWAVKVMGENWSYNIELKESHNLVKNGPYNFLRHPVYFARLVEVAAISMILNSPVTFIFSITAHFILLSVRIDREERLLLERFGNEFIEYRKKTGGLFPKL